MAQSVALSSRWVEFVFAVPVPWSLTGERWVPSLLQAAFPMARRPIEARAESSLDARAVTPRPSLVTEMAGAVPSDDFDEVLTAERARLFNTAYSVLRDRGDAEDAVQETMVQAWRKWDTLRDPLARSAWLTRICLNHCFRRRTRLARVVPFAGRRREEHLGDALQAGEGSDRSYQERPWAAHRPAPEAPDLDLERAYDRLPVRQRAAVLLHYHHGYTIDTCADLMECRPGTVRTHVQRALASLRRELTDE